MDTKDSVSPKMEQIALNAKRLPDVSFTSLAHHIDLRWLYEAFKETRKDGAVGIDKVTAEDYEKELKSNLRRLLELAKSGRYKAPPVKRTYIPKDGTKEKRPLGIPTFEDKIIQKAVKWVIEPIYEQDFYECSYGFRPNRSQHMALKVIWKKLMDMGGSWIIDLDIRKFFDSIKWNILEGVIKRRVCDGVLIQKLRGHYGYYGINGNFSSIKMFYRNVERIWRKWLERRSRKRNLYWIKMKKILKTYPLPYPRIVHSNV